MAVKSRGNRLALVVLDPWEVRFAATVVLPTGSQKRAKVAVSALKRVICRERPQVIAVAKGKSTARTVAMKTAKKLGVPVMIIAGNRATTGSDSNGSPFPLPIKADPLLLAAHATAEAALTQITKQTYAALHHRTNR